MTRLEMIKFVEGLGAEACGYYVPGEHNQRTWMESTCDCKFGGPNRATIRVPGGRPVSITSEQTGCPELRLLHKALSRMSDYGWDNLTGFFEQKDVCATCQQPLGEGTLYHSSPIPPADVGTGMTEDAWKEFALRFRCPACAAVRSASEAILQSGPLTPADVREAAGLDDVGWICEKCQQRNLDADRECKGCGRAPGEPPK